MGNNRRKIIYQDGSYQLLKQKENGNWYGYGKRKSLKAISNLMLSLEFDLEISEQIRREVERYRVRERERREEYFERKELSSKVI